MAIQTYDPKLVIVTYGGVTITGFADKKFVEVDLPDIGFEGFTGAYGEGGRVVKNSQKGTCKLTLLQVSAANDILTGFWFADLATLTGAKTLSVTDVNGTSKLFAPGAYIKRLPNMSFSTDVESREWELEFVAVGDMVVGSNRIL